jgi:hypothetical protein
MASQSLKLAGKQFVIVPKKEYDLLQRKARTDKPKSKNRNKSRTGRAAMPPMEVYTDERIAEFLLSNSVDAEDYSRACDEVRKLGLDPAKISHVKPAGTA